MSAEAPQWPRDWPAVRTTLLTARRAAAARADGDWAAQRRALAALAAAPLLRSASTRSDDPAERGRVLHVHLAAAVSAVADNRDGAAATRDAALLWARIVTTGRTVRQLAADEHGGRDRVGLDRAVRRYKRLAWLGGEPASPSSEAAVRAVFHAVVAASDADLDEDACAVPGPVGFAYEWEGVVHRGDDAEMALLAIGAHCGDAPVPLRLLAEGHAPLPAALRRLARRPPDLRPVVAVLGARGLAAYEGPRADGVAFPRAVRDAVRGVLSERARKDAASALLRCLRVALPPAVHDHATWADWDAGPPHVEAAVGHCQSYGIRPADCVYLLDRAAVYVRDALDDPERALRIGERADAHARATGAADPVDAANALGNMAIACGHLRRYDDAVDLMSRSAEQIRAAVGEHHVEHVEAVLGLANALKSAGRADRAREQYDTALARAERAQARGQTGGRALLAEVLNDYSHSLLQLAEGADDPDGDVAAADRMLGRAVALLRPGDYGWHQVSLNAAAAAAARGRPADAARMADDLLPYCVATFGEHSYPAFAVLADLADYLEAAGDPRAAEVLLRAHDVDAWLAAPADGRPRRAAGEQ